MHVNIRSVLSLLLCLGLLGCAGKTTASPITKSPEKYLLVCIEADGAVLDDQGRLSFTCTVKEVIPQ